MCFAFIVAHGKELALVAETDAEGVLEHAGGRPWEVLEDGVGGDVRQTERILLPLGAHGQHL